MKTIMKIAAGILALTFFAKYPSVIFPLAALSGIIYLMWKKLK